MGDDCLAKNVVRGNYRPSRETVITSRETVITSCETVITSRETVISSRETVITTCESCENVLGAPYTLAFSTRRPETCRVSRVQPHPEREPCLEVLVQLEALSAICARGSPQLLDLSTILVLHDAIRILVRHECARGVDSFAFDTKG